MKKALIITALSGFISAFLISDIEILLQMGYEVYCAANDGESKTGAAKNFWIEHHVTFVNIDFDSKNPASQNNIAAYNEIRELLARERFDLIHCHTPIAGFITRLAARKYRKQGTKVIYTTHGFYFHKHAPKKDWIKYYPIEKLASAWCDAIVTINEEDLQCAKRMWCRKCFKINSVGLDTKRYLDIKLDRQEYRKSIGVEENDIMILAAGELSARKNHIVIIRALAKIRDPKYVFVICGQAVKGSGTYDLIEQTARENNVRVKFLGFRRDMPELFSCADISVMPSKREGLGMAGLQSMIVGVPVIGSNVHGIVDYVIPGKTGYLFDPDDVDGFAAGIEKLSDPEVRNAMKQNCIDTAMKFSKEVSWKQKEEIYKEVLCLN